MYTAFWDNNNQGIVTYLASDVAENIALAVQWINDAGGRVTKVEYCGDGCFGLYSDSPEYCIRKESEWELSVKPFLTEIYCPWGPLYSDSMVVEQPIEGLNMCPRCVEAYNNEH